MLKIYVDNNKLTAENAHRTNAVPVVTIKIIVITLFTIIL